MRLNLGLIDFERTTDEGIILSTQLNSSTYSGVMGGIIMGRFKKIAGILRGSLVEVADDAGLSLEAMEISLINGDRNYALTFPYPEKPLIDPVRVRTGKLPVDEHARHSLELWRALTSLSKAAIVQRLVESFFADKGDHLAQKVAAFAAVQDLSVRECREMLISGESFPKGEVMPLISMGLCEPDFGG